MHRFRIFLGLMFVALLIYTIVVSAEHGMGLLPIFFGDIAAMGWPGQFNADFLCMLILSGLWLAWRHQFSAAGIVLGLCGLFGGALFLTLYLLIQSFRVEQRWEVLLLGPRATMTGTTSGH